MEDGMEIIDYNMESCYMASNAEKGLVKKCN